MTTDDGRARSMEREGVDLGSITCSDQPDPLVRLDASARIDIRPIWQDVDDIEGKQYIEYQRDHPEYNAVYVRAGLAERLWRAADLLDSRYKLIVKAGHRPVEVQLNVLHGIMRNYRAEHPNASNDEALTHARTYVRDPAILLPPHCCGAAVDVELLDTSTNKLVDFGSPINLDAPISYLHSNEITDAQKQNRMVLLNAMLTAGFASYYAEWWHYSYGDQFWAWFYNHESCLYGLIDK